MKCKYIIHARNYTEKYVKIITRQMCEHRSTIPNYDSHLWQSLELIGLNLQDPQTRKKKTELKIAAIKTNTH